MRAFYNDPLVFKHFETLRNLHWNRQLLIKDLDEEILKDHGSLWIKFFETNFATPEFLSNQLKEFVADIIKDPDTKIKANKLNKWEYVYDFTPN